MIEVRWIGRGGQGAFTASKILGDAAVKSGLYGLAFPSFGPERRGAPLQAFTKIGEDPISNRTEIKMADYIVVLDETLFNPNLLDDLKDTGKLIVNTAEVFEDERIIEIDGLHLALEVLKRPITNTAMVGALIGVSDLIDINIIEDVLSNHLSPRLVPSNIGVIEQAYKLGRERLNEKTGA